MMGNKLGLRAIPRLCVWSALVVACLVWAVLPAAAQARVTTPTQVAGVTSEPAQATESTSDLAAAYKRMQSAYRKLLLENDALKAKAEATSGEGQQRYTLLNALAAETNMHAVSGALARSAYGGGNGAIVMTQNGLPGSVGGGGLTQADLEKAVKTAVEANKSDWDKMPWYYKIPATLGSLYLLQGLGIAIPGIN